MVTWGVGLALGASGAVARGQFSLQTIPVPGIPTALSGDGTTVVSYTSTIAYKWSAAGGLVNLGMLPGDISPIPNGVSYDGSVVVGMGNLNGWRWTAQTGPVALGAFPGAFSSPARGVSRDGSVVVGEGALVGGQLPSHAYRWTQQTGLVDLGTLPGHMHSMATAVSGDGSIVVGVNGLGAGPFRAFRWTQQGGMVDLGTLPGETTAWAYDISDDGLVIVGGSDNQPFRWTQQTGMVDLGGGGAAVAVSANGARIIGSDWYWIEGQGQVGLLSYLSQNGVNTTGWLQLFAEDISDDGGVIIGRGNLNGASVNFMATVPSPGSAVLTALGLAPFLHRHRGKATR